MEDTRKFPSHAPPLIEVPLYIIEGILVYNKWNWNREFEFE